MSSSARRSALTALDAARASIARLGTTGSSEDVAADLIESWSAVESALRALVGTSALSGQPLIREARQRQLLTFEQANVLAEFLAARDRSERVDYRPTSADVAAAREAFAKLDAGLRADTPAPWAPPPVPAPSVPPGDAGAGASTSSGTAPATLGGTRGPRRVWLIPAIAAAAVIIIAVGLYVFFSHRTSATMQQAVAEYGRGQRDLASQDFTKAERENPNDPLPHVYLSRMARDVGNLTVAQEEAQLAVQADPHNALALREMGSYLLTVGNYDLARRFYVRAVQADETDNVAQGWLGCTLYKLGRADEGQKWISRAGAGAWTNCAQTSTPGVAIDSVPRNPPGVRSP